MSQSQFVDYKLNSSFLPHCLLPEDDTSRVFARLFFLFYFIISFLSVSLKTFARNEKCVSVHSMGLIFDADCRVVRFVRRTDMNGREVFFFFFSPLLSIV